MAVSQALNDLLRHLEWTDAEIWKTVLEQADLPLDSKLEGWLHHVHTVQHAFLHIWRGEPVELPAAAEFPEPPSLARWGREAHSQIRAALADAEEAELQRELDIPWAAHVEERFGSPIRPVTLEQSVLQITLHTTHHRGQVVARLRELGGEPPLIDFIAWIWSGQPAPDWPAET